MKPTEYIRIIFVSILSIGHTLCCAWSLDTIYYKSTTCAHVLSLLKRKPERLRTETVLPSSRHSLRELSLASTNHLLSWLRWATVVAAVRMLHQIHLVLCQGCTLDDHKNINIACHDTHTDTLLDVTCV